MVIFFMIYNRLTYYNTDNNTWRKRYILFVVLKERWEYFDPEYLWNVAAARNVGGYIIT